MGCVAVGEMEQDVHTGQTYFMSVVRGLSRLDGTSYTVGLDMVSGKKFGDARARGWSRLKGTSQ